MNLKSTAVLTALAGALLASAAPLYAADVTFERLLNPEPHNWLMVHHDYGAQRFSTLIRTLRARGFTLVLVEHNMNVVMSVSDRIVVLHHGVGAEWRHRTDLLRNVVGGAIGKAGECGDERKKRNQVAHETNLKTRCR